MPDDLPILDELGGDLRAAFRRRARRRRWLVPAAVAATAAAGALALVTGLDSGRVAPVPATAAQVLRQAAHAAAGAPAPFPREDQFFYVRSSTTNLMSKEPPERGEVAIVTRDRWVWTSLKRPGRLREQFVSAIYPGATPEQRARLESIARETTVPGELGSTHLYHLGAFKLTRQGLLAFPTDPRTIYERLRANVGTRGRSPEGEVFTEIGDALRESPAPAALRAGLYGALALIPGIELVGDVTDRAGRGGVAVAFTEAGVRSELIFDPATSEMLAERSVLTRPRPDLGLAAGTVIGDSVYLERAVVDELP
jgi:hypothetical protein